MRELVRQIRRALARLERELEGRRARDRRLREIVKAQRRDGRCSVADPVHLEGQLDVLHRAIEEPLPR